MNSNIRFRRIRLISPDFRSLIGDVINIDYGFHEVHVYAEARNIHSNAEAMASTSDSLDITPEDLSVSDNVKVEWELINKDRKPDIRP